MRKWLLYAAALAAAAILNIPGFHGTDVGRLMPVEAVRISREGEKILLETDTGDTGMGADVESAIRDLKAVTPGNVFLDTADYLIVQPGCEALLEELSTHLRPSCGVCTETEPADPEKAAAYLRVHEPQITLLEWENGMGRMPQLLVNGERMKLVQ